MKGQFKEAIDKARAKQTAWIKAQYAKGLTQQQIAEKIGLTRQRVQQILAQP